MTQLVKIYSNTTDQSMYIIIYRYELLTKCEVKMAGYWPSSFFACLWTETKSRSINPWKKNQDNIQSSWLNKLGQERIYYMAFGEILLAGYSRKSRAGKMEPSCPLGTTRCIPQAKLPRKLYKINLLLTKFARSRWLDIGLVPFLRVYGPRFRLRP